MNAKQAIANLQEQLACDAEALIKRQSSLALFAPFIDEYEGEISLSFGFPVQGQSIDIDNVTREQLPSLMQHLSAGKWTKEQCSSTTVNYINTTLLPYPIRIYGVRPPDSCKLVEYEELIPARPAEVVKRFRMVCHDEPSLPSETEPVAQETPAV